MAGIEIPEQVEKIIEKLNTHGYEAYAVGGCVRDSLLGRIPEDWDITTSAKPEEVKQIFGRTVDTGIQHGTVTVMEGRTGYEVTTYRIDGEYEDSRHPKSVKFTSNLLEDLKRRDFTINAMAYNRAAGIVDAFGGMADLELGIIRCVGNPEERFGEDALRILRAIRFSAQLGFTVEEMTLRAVRKAAPNLTRASRERIQTELTKLLCSPHPDRINMVEEAGISPYLPEHFAAVDCRKVEVRAELPASKHMRWAAFLKEVSERDAAAVLRELKMDNDTISRVCTMVRLWRSCPPDDRASLRRLMSGIKPERYDDLLVFQKIYAGELDGASDDAEACREYLERVEKISREIRKAGDCVSRKQLAVSGRELIGAGIKPGKEMGEILDRLLEIVLEKPEMNTKENLLQCVRERI